MIITIKRPDVCADCGAKLEAGEKARFYRSGKVYGLACHEQKKPGETRPETVGGGVLASLGRADAEAQDTYAAYVAKHYQQPVFAVVENARGDLLSNPREPERRVGVMYDVCGFVWLEVRFKEGAHFLTAFKKAAGQGLRNGEKVWSAGGSYTNSFGTKLNHRFELRYYKSGYGSPWRLSVPSVGYGNGAMSAMEAAGAAFAQSMAVQGYPGIRVESRID